MKRFLVSITIITLFFSLVFFVNAQTLQKEQDVNVRATVPEIHALRVKLLPPTIIETPNLPGVPYIKVVNKTETSAEIVWKTVQPASSYVDYGLTKNYEIGTIFSPKLVKDHRVKLTELQPKITYHFRIRSRDIFGNEIVSKDHTFVLPDLTPPANVRNFTAQPGNETITLTWQNPADKDFQGVRVQMSTISYPIDPFDGKTVYDGKETSYTILNLKNDIRYYFTAFSYDDSGNFTSGAIASAVPTIEIVPPEEIPFIPPELKPEIADIILEDISFSIEGVQIFPDQEGVLIVKAGQVFKISIPVEKFPKVLKTIITVIGDRTSSYLLRINPEETAYEAIIFAPEIPKTYPMTTIIMDFKQGTVAKIPAFLRVEAIEARPLLNEEKPVAEEASWIPLLVLIGILSVIGIVMGHLKRKNLSKCILLSVNL